MLPKLLHNNIAIQRPRQFAPVGAKLIGEFYLLLLKRRILIICAIALLDKGRQHSLHLFIKIACLTPLFCQICLKSLLLLCQLSI